jgi:pyocin large subunit-like protein
MGGRGARTGGAKHPGLFLELTRERHFRDHGSDFGTRSAVEYEQMAIAFAQRQSDPGIESFVSDARVVYVYERSTNTYLMYREEGALMTFMKPTSPTYWQRQREKHEPLGE